MDEAIELLVNGETLRVDAEPATKLLEVLRDDLGLTGTKYGCGEGQCGACTVLIGGQPVRACQVPISACAGKPVATVEGLEKDGKLHPLQEAFLDLDAMQCGYCTAGMIMAAHALLAGNPSPSEAEIMQGMSGNICRCCTYPRIVAAIQRAAKNLREVE